MRQSVGFKFDSDSSAGMWGIDCWFDFDTDLDCETMGIGYVELSDCWKNGFGLDVENVG